MPRGAVLIMIVMGVIAMQRKSAVSSGARVVTVSSSGEVRALDWRIDEDSDVSYVEPPGGGPAWGTATVEAEPEFFSLRECLVAHYKYTKTNHPALLRPTEVAKHANKQDYHDNED
jgi:hypothetical protein